MSSGSLINGDRILDYAKGAAGTGDLIDFLSTLTVGGNATAATATSASIATATGIATFAAASGTTMVDALADITTKFTSATDTSGEFTFFRVNNAGNFYMFVSDGAAGVTANDCVIELVGVTTIGSMGLTSGDLTILS